MEPIKGMRKGVLACGITGLMLLSGCATVNQMALKQGDKTLDLNGKGLALMSLTVANHYKPDYQPKVFVVQVETPHAKSKKDRQNFKIDADGTIVTTHGPRYLARMALTPGHYIIRGAMCMYKSLFITAFCEMPIQEDIDIKANQVSYLGRVAGTIRKSHGDELHAGSALPLIDQAVTGFSSGTFDVKISDRRKEDMKLFRKFFPALDNTPIQMAIMAPFDRERAKIWFDSDGAKDKPEHGSGKKQTASIRK